MKYKVLLLSIFVMVLFANTISADWYSFDFGMVAEVRDTDTISIVNPVPANQTEDAKISTTPWQITINQISGDKFNWTIETSPDVGSSANDSSDASRMNGTKDCPLSGISDEVTYTVYVNVTDENEISDSKTFWFKARATRYSASFGMTADVCDWDEWSPWWVMTRVTMIGPTDFAVANFDSSAINLTWTKNPLALTTSIIRKKGSSPADHDDGTEIYNSTGELFDDTSLDPGTHYYYKAWSYNDEDGFSLGTSSNDSWSSPGDPSTLLSPEQGIDYVNLSWTKGTNTTDTVIRYQTGSYPATPQSGSEGYNDTGSVCQVSSLAEATPYYFRAWSYSNGYFSDSYVSLLQSTTGDLQPPSSFTASNFDSDRIDLSWTNNGYADTTHVRGKKGSSPSSVTDGFLVYNSTGESYQHTGLDPGTHYYYKAWSFNTSQGFSTGASDDDWTSPGDPSNLQNTSITSDSINLTWTKGTNATNTVIRYNDSSYPANPQSGAEGYNDTGVFVNITSLPSNTNHYIRAWSYSNGYFSDSYDNMLTTTYGTNPSPSGFTASNFDNSSINLTWTNGAEADSTSIVRKKDSSPSDHDDGTEIYNSTGELFDDTSLDQGTHYYYKAWSYNITSGWSSPVSSDDWTSPGNPTNFVNGTISYTSIEFNWDDGTNASIAVVRYQTGSYPATPQSGSEGYNGSLDTCTVESLITNTTYFFRIWSYVNPFSEEYMDLELTTLSTETPAPPFNASVEFITGGVLNITWERGLRSDEDVVVRKASGYPATWDDGETLDRTNNSTGPPPIYYYNNTVEQGYYYSLFSYNITNVSYSVACQVPQYGGLGLNCFNESTPSQAINFDILISNENASQTFYAEDITNTYWVDIGDIPYGTDTIFYISNSSYKSRTYYYDIELGSFYNLTFYLPPKETTDPGDGGGDTGTLRVFTNVVSVTNPDVNTTIPLSHLLESIIEVATYNVLYDEKVKVDSITVSNPLVNITIPLTYTLEDVISVEVYNVVYEQQFKSDSVSVSDPDVDAIINFTKTVDEILGVYIYNSSIYGGWVTVPNDQYIINSVNCTVDASAMDDNSTIAKVEYYYMKESYGQWQTVSNDNYDASTTEVEIDDAGMTSNTTMARVEYYYLEETLGQWVTVPEDMFSSSSTQVEIDDAILTSNTTMARAEYYYMDYENTSTATRLYILKVINEYDVPIQNATVTIKRYITSTEGFEAVTILKTDGNGQVETYLIPHVLYKIFITAESYHELEISEWIPDEEFYGIYHPKYFRMTFIVGSSNYGEDIFERITWSIEPVNQYHNDSFWFYFNISSQDADLEYYHASAYYWNTTQATWILLNDTNVTTQPGGGSISFYMPNITGRYSFVAKFKREGQSEYHFGAEDGCRIHYIYYEQISRMVADIPALAYLIITIIFTLLVMGFLAKFGAGIHSGIPGLAVMGGMFALRPELTFGNPPISVWIIFLATAIVYFVVLFISRRIQ